MRIPVLMSIMIASATALADNSTLDAAIGGGVGGAVGAAIGNELGGREAAIAGGALGAAVGTAVNTGAQPVRRSPSRERYRTYAPSDHQHEHYHFCPPGQAKKGRC